VAQAGSPGCGVWVEAPDFQAGSQGLKPCDPSGNKRIAL
jgi:hypothetical protein